MRRSVFKPCVMKARCSPYYPLVGFEGASSQWRKAVSLVRLDRQAFLRSRWQTSLEHTMRLARRCKR